MADSHISKMKDDLLAQAPTPPPPSLLHHLERLDDDYFQEFDIPTIQRHHSLIQSLNADRLCACHSVRENDTTFLLTIAAFDFPGIFAIMCGLLARYQLDIRTGMIFTYKKCSDEPLKTDYYLQRKKIIDTFTCRHHNPTSLPDNIDDHIQQTLQGYLQHIRDNHIEKAHHDLEPLIREQLSPPPSGYGIKLLPLEINTDIRDNNTVLSIEGQDTPAFLYALGSALSMRGISIHKVIINTDGSQVHDLIYITDRYDRPITDPNYLKNITCAVAFIKHFTLFLPLAADPALALKQFNLFLDALLNESTADIDLSHFNQDGFMASLAKIFGTGTYHWEEFIRMQHEALLPFLKSMDAYKYQKDKATLLQEVSKILSEQDNLGDKFNAMNAYKDQELFRIDIMHLIYPSLTFQNLSEELTCHAEVIVEATTELIYAQLVHKHGLPQTAHDHICQFAIMALGKFGGRELGYASDLELVIIYEGPGWTTNSEDTVPNATFFNTLVQQLKESIRSKQDGIFEIDLRLRPYGNKGLLACSLQRWREYYNHTGNALDYERQALIKLRPIFGDTTFCDHIMGIRDAIVFRQPPVSIQSSMDIRKKQIEEHTAPGKINAKISAGGLVDLEFSIQYLQLQHGCGFPELRQANTIKALEALLEYGLINPTEFEKLYNSYAFQRRLINALRIVHGHARDLDIPLFTSDAFLFLARNLGYVPKGSISSQQQLQDDITSHFKTVETFYENKFILHQDIVFPESGFSALIKLVKDPSKLTSLHPFLHSLNIVDPVKACKTLHRLMEHIKDQHGLVAVLVLAERFIRQSPDPDKALMNFDHLLLKIQRPTHFLIQLLYNPRTIEILMTIFGHSDYLSNFLFSDPELLQYITNDRVLFFNKSYDHFTSELHPWIASCQTTDDIMEQIRKYQKREILRIGLRDVYLHVDLERTVKELSDLTDAIVHIIWTSILKSHNCEHMLDHMSVIALGKLGGRELNYSSDIDLVFVMKNTLLHTEEQRSLMHMIEAMIHHITHASPAGKLFRVDTRLRPYGQFGGLIGTEDYYQNYYRDKADGWELQAWLKARSIAGNMSMGQKLITTIQGWLVDPERRTMIEQSILSMRRKMLLNLLQKNISHREVKLGPGGIRAIEFIVQKHVIQYGRMYPDVICGHTLYALEKLRTHQLIAEDVTQTLKGAYIFLRMIEHRIQLLGLQQSHILPVDPTEMSRLAKRMGYEDRLEETALNQFLKHYATHTNTIEDLAEKYFQ